MLLIVKEWVYEAAEGLLYLFPFNYLWLLLSAQEEELLTLTPHREHTLRACFLL